MDYAFTGVESVVRSQKKRSDSRPSRVNARGELLRKVEHAKHALGVLVLTSHSEDACKTLIRFHQRSLLTLADRIASKNLTDQFGSVIKELLDFLAFGYPQYFDFHAPIPALVRSDLTLKISECIAIVSDPSLLLRIGPSLVTMVNSTLMSIQASQFPMNFLDAKSIEQFCDNFNRLENYAGEELEEHVLSIYVATDLDCQHAFEYFTTQFRNDLVKADSDQERLNLVALQLKKISQILLTTHVPRANRRLKTMLTEWLLNELQYLERRVTNVVVQSKPETTFKLTVDLSVAQLAFITRALVESGVIQNKNTSEMMSFLSKFITTKRSGSISSESLRIKYYDVESGTKESVRNILHNAIGYINRS